MKEESIQAAKQTFWEYCAELAGLFEIDGKRAPISRNANRRVLDEIEMVAACFDAEILPFDCALRIAKRESFLPKI